MINYIKRIWMGYEYKDNKRGILYVKNSYIIQLRNFIFPSWAETERLMKLYKAKFEAIKKTKKIIDLSFKALKNKEINIKSDGVVFIDGDNGCIQGCNLTFKIDKPLKGSLFNVLGSNLIVSNSSFIGIPKLYDTKGHKK